MTDEQARKFFEDMAYPDKQKAYNEFVEREKEKLAEQEEAEAARREYEEDKRIFLENIR